jgi:uncharacterized membrane protein
MNGPNSLTAAFRTSHATARRLATVTTAVAISLILGAAAKADIMVCNDIAAPIHVAFAYPDRDGFTASGWWNIESNECQRVDFQFQGPTLYYSADSDGYRDGRATSRDHWGNKEKLFVTRTKFDFDNADRSRRGTRAELFSSYEIPPSYLGKPTAITFHFIHGSTNINISTGK